MCLTHLVLLPCYDISTCTSSFLYEHNTRSGYSENKIHQQLLMKFITEVKTVLIIQFVHLHCKYKKVKTKRKRKVEVLKPQSNY